MSFELDIELFAEAVTTATEEVARGTFIDATTRIILRTPVDKGRARGNWFADINNYSSQVTDSVDKSGHKAQADAKQTALSFKVGESMSLVNNLPYIIPLEDGSSTQAPSGMVKVTFTEIENYLKRRAATIR